jgi:hypothetical protein
MSTSVENPENPSTKTWSKPGASLSMTDLVAFPRRPSKANFGAPVRLQTNSFRLMNSNSSIKDINKYSVNFEPVIPDNSRISGKIIKGVREQIKADLNFII